MCIRDSSSAGHVDSGETYEKCAHRELWEELQIKEVLIPLTKIGACVETYQENIQVYICQTNKIIKINIGKFLFVEIWVQQSAL